MKLRIILKNYNDEYPRYIVQKQIIPLFWKNIQEFIIPIFCKLNAYHFNNKEKYEKISNTKTMIFMKNYEAVIKNNKYIKNQNIIYNTKTNSSSNHNLSGSLSIIDIQR